MATLYVRGVPDDVAQTLKDRAAARGISLSSYVTAELALLAHRPTNAEIVARLRARDRTKGPTTNEILAALEEGRR